MLKWFIRTLKMGARKKEEENMKDDASIHNACEWLNYNGEFTKDTEIIRFTKMKYFLEMLEKEENVLPHISGWKDVWEGFIYKIKYFLQGIPVSTRNLLQDFFGQSWSMCTKPSELLWRARCPDGDGICMLTTIGQLAESVQSCVEDTAKLNTSFRLKPVIYIPEKEFIEKMRSIATNSEIASDILCNLEKAQELFFWKRDLFDDEKEVRLLFMDEGTCFQNRVFVEKKLVRYHVDKDRFLTAVIADPRMSDDDFQNLKKTIEKKGWKTPEGNKLPLSKSPLYSFPSTIVNLP